jgi:hypothetical protein
MEKDKRIRRRDILRVFGAGATAAVTASGPLSQNAVADNEPDEERRRARYQPNSPDVQAFYRVNRYPPK